MLVPVMRVVNVTMVVNEFVVRMVVLVAFGEMKVEAHGHEHPCCAEAQRQLIAQENDGQRDADEWRQREIGTGPSGPEVAKRRHKQREADAIAEETDEASERGGTGGRQVYALKYR